MDFDINEIISRYLEGNASAAEKQQLLDWLEENEGNKKLFNEMKDIYFVSGSVSSSDKYNDRHNWFKEKSKIGKSKARKLQGALKYAAILVFAMLIGSVITQFAESFLEGDVELTRVEIPNGQMSKLTLFDGTEVWLNSGSVFEYPNQFNTKERKVYLQGEAFFDVAKNEKLPFVIESDKMHVKVLGTSFNFSSYENDDFANLTLIEGNVNLLTPGGQLLTRLVPGEKADLKDGKISIKKVDTSFYSLWKEGKIEFTSVPLGEIAKKLERWYNVSIEFHDKDLEKIKFSGTVLKHKPVEQIIKAIRLLSPIDYRVTFNPNGKNEIEIFAKQ